MPRPKRPGAPEPKKRSRNGCWPCKTRKIKCDEGRPSCVNCKKQGETCDYSIRLNWDGRGNKKTDSMFGSGQIDFSTGTVSVAPETSHEKEQATTSTTRQNEQQSSVSVATKSVPSRSTQKVDLSEDRLHRDGQTDPQGFTTQETFAAGNETSMIDSSLVHQTESMYSGSIFDNMHSRGDQYTQSYERYHSNIPPMTSSSHSPRIPRQREFQATDDSYLSPSNYSMRSPSISNISSRSIMLTSNSPGSTPPISGSNKEDTDLSDQYSYERPAKRIRSEQDTVSNHSSSMPPPYSTSFGPCVRENSESQNISTTISNPVTPRTPMPTTSEDGQPRSNAEASYSHSSHDTANTRRLSVNSLLSGPPKVPSKNERFFRNTSSSDSQSWSSNNIQDETTTWGVDRGFKDLDIGKNNDMNAISGASPSSTRDHLDLILDSDGDVQPVEFGFGSETAFQSGGYYDKPVSISIPRSLEPLPTKLLENPMNLLYFHHFLNHTAGCLIPHNCSSNPFKRILPQMAVRDDNLLNLLLAYSASHRARLLRQPEPATRIALWVQDIFPNLRHALDDPNKIISNANLATAVMLASLEIISPKAFGVAVPWQKHLDTARQMIAARGGPQRMQTASRGDKVSSFLWSWFAYLDVLGSLSGGGKNLSSSYWILDYEFDEDEDYQIDCILGFTSRCVRILAKIAELARTCDTQRIGPDLTIIPDWQPPEHLANLAKNLRRDLNESRAHPAKPCTHMQSKDEAAYQWDSLEMATTNEAFHWAGMIHLDRRVFGKPTTHPDVQEAVHEILDILYKIRPGSSTEACLLFPMFTAGCDIQDEKKRSYILERIKSVERFAMTQVHQARTLMERVWETGKPWETLVAGEFFG